MKVGKKKKEKKTVVVVSLWLLEKRENSLRKAEWNVSSVAAVQKSVDRKFSALRRKIHRSGEEKKSGQFSFQILENSFQESETKNENNLRYKAFKNR